MAGKSGSGTDALSLCRQISAENRDIEYNDLRKRIIRTLDARAFHNAKDEIIEYLISQKLPAGLIQQSLRIIANRPGIEYLELKHDLCQQFDMQTFNKCKVRVKRLLRRRENSNARPVPDSTSAGTISSPTSDAFKARSSASDGSLRTRKVLDADGGKSKLAKRRFTLDGTMRASPILEQDSEGKAHWKASGSKRVMRRTHSQTIKMAAAASRERRRGKIAAMPSIREQMTMPELRTKGSFHVDSPNTKLRSDTDRIPDAEELIIMLSMDEVLSRRRRGSCVSDFNTKLIKALKWVMTDVLDTADKSKEHAAMSPVPGKGALRVDVVVLCNDEMGRSQDVTWRRTRDKVSNTHFYFNTKTRRSTWTSPTAVTDGNWVEHMHEDGSCVYENRANGTTVHQKPHGFDASGKRLPGSVQLELHWAGIETMPVSSKGLAPGVKLSDVELARICVNHVRRRRRPPWQLNMSVKVLYLARTESDVSNLRFALKGVNSENTDGATSQIYVHGAAVPFGESMSTYCGNITRALLAKPAPVASRLIKWSLFDADDKQVSTTSATQRTRVNHIASIFSATKCPGRYVLLPKPLGAGAFGTVYAAINSDGGKVAVKNIDKIVMRRKRKENDVNHELGIMCWLSRTDDAERSQYQGSHPNIMSLIEIFEEPDSMNIVVEIAEGGSFFDVCKNKFMEDKKPFSEKEARHFFRQMLSGLNFCHKKGIAHRDLKPENLLLGGPLSATLKICDFGLANWVQSSRKDAEVAIARNRSGSVGTSTSRKGWRRFFSVGSRKGSFDSRVEKSDSEGRARGIGSGGSHSHIDDAAFVGVNTRFLKTCGKGTVMYMAPELWERKKYDAFSTDIWAMGVILYLMLHGRYPFSVKTIKASVRRRRSKQVVDLGRVYHAQLDEDMISADAQDLVRRLLCINPDKRISLTGIMNHPWMCKVSRQSIVGVLRDGGVFAVRRQGWLMYRGHGMLGRLVNKRRWITVGGHEIRVYQDETRCNLKKYMRLGTDSILHDISTQTSEILVTTSGADGVEDEDENRTQYKDAKCVHRIALRCLASDRSVIKEWYSAIALEIKSACDLGAAHETEKASLSAGLEDASRQLRNGAISWDEYSALRKKILEDP